MPIPLLKFPVLVQDEIIKEMDWPDIFVLSLIKEGRRAIKRNYCKQVVRLGRFEEYCYLESLTNHPHDLLEFYFENREDHGKKNRRNVFKCILPEFLGCKAVHMECYDSVEFKFFLENKEDKSNEMLEYLLGIFPKASLHLSFHSSTLARYTKTIELAERLGLKQVIVILDEEYSNEKDEVIKRALNPSLSVAKLHINCMVTPNFELDPKDCVSLKYKTVFIEWVSWISRDHFIRLFMDCEFVNLDLKQFSEEDLSIILKRWTEGSELKDLILKHINKSLPNVVAGLKYAVPIEKAIIQVDDEPEKSLFKDNGCFMIQQENGTKALVFEMYEFFHLTTNFELPTDDDTEGWLLVSSPQVSDDESEYDEEEEDEEDEGEGEVEEDESRNN